MFRVPKTPDPVDWRPAADSGALRARAGMLGCIRAHFASTGVLEVETPIASSAAVSDPSLESLVTRWRGCGADLTLYLQTSPEFSMKRLLAAGSGPIFQVCKVFRDDERGRRHHPEFSLLEWYRPGWGYRELMDEVAGLVRQVLEQPALVTEHWRYRDLFCERLDLDPWTCAIGDLERAADHAGISGADALELDKDGWLDLLLTHCLESGLGRGCMTFLYDYPPSQAALAQVTSGPDAVARRFELYVEGVELANGFQELTDAGIQESRFQQDLAQRAGQGQSEPPVDGRFLAALRHGMPETSGVALGLDRLLMLKLGVDHIDQVLAFPVERA